MAEIQRKNAKKKSAGRQAWTPFFTGISMIPFIASAACSGASRGYGRLNIAADDMKAVGGLH